MKKNCLETLCGYIQEAPDREQEEAFYALGAKARLDAIRMIRAAGSGHVGGSMSSADCLELLLLGISEEKGDRVIVSHGHIAPIYYSLLGNLGYFDPAEAIAGLRRGSRFEGHPSLQVDGVTWCSGILGQGLSVGAGFALAEKIKQQDGKIYVLMGDGEQDKGQIAEAARFAAKYGLDNLCCIIDVNLLQASGSVDDIMRTDLAALYSSCGFAVVEADGHDFRSLYAAVRKKEKHPKVILARTVMCREIDGAENNFRFHGELPDCNLLDDAEEKLRNHAAGAPVFERRRFRREEPLPVTVPPGIQYPAEKKIACRTAAASAFYELCAKNKTAVAVDCDLSGSMKLDDVKRDYPLQLIECGISEQNAASVSAGLAKAGICTFWFDFGVMNLDEAYSQIRMAQINKAPLKLVSTHCGLDVGEDGKTHQCTDYIAVAASLFDVRLFVPGDANQADAAIREMARETVPCILACGRSNLPVLKDEKGDVLYKNDACLGTTVVREGNDAAILSCGTLLGKAIRVSDRMKKEGFEVRVINVCEPLRLSDETVLTGADTGILITYEDHNVRTGLFSLAAQKLAGKKICRMAAMGIAEHGGSDSAEHLYEKAELSEESLYLTVKRLLEEKKQ